MTMMKKMMMAYTEKEANPSQLCPCRLVQLPSIHDFRGDLFAVTLLLALQFANRR